MTASEHHAQPHLKKVGKIAGHFFVPPYQRGYRWGKHEVKALLDDIYIEGKRGKSENYCLQPVVVKRLEAGGAPFTDDGAVQAADHFELIDGQQRLTTLYLIYHYLQKLIGDNIKLPFSLSYRTRPRSTDYLLSLDPSEKNDNIDFFHMYGAYQCIGEWFEAAAERTDTALQFVGFQIYGYLQNQVHVIWYDAGGVDPTTLFTRLNVGRIALTNAELVKALLLARRGENGLVEEHRQIEIATQWDMIEQALQDDEFWAFLTNKLAANYPARIEFLFDLITKKPEWEKERFHTFLRFKELLEGLEDRDARKVWASVLERYHLLREWFENRELYHKVGYLVAIGIGLDKLVDESNKVLTKTCFRACLDDRIKSSLDLDAAAVRELSYDTDYEKCERLLLLFNVESVRRLAHSSERYPFHSHKAENWSLEHIHAQHAEQLNTEAQWQSWLRDSRRALAAMRLDNPDEETGKQALLDEIDREVAGKVTGPVFKVLSRRVMEDFLHPAGAEDAVHSITNLALLSGSVNSTLNNAAFQAKRLRVIELDREGKFIPICTRRAFFKYYTEADSQQTHLWSREDQVSYLDKMISPDQGIGHYLKAAAEVRS
jgi:Protein of unknown function DUF262